MKITDQELLQKILIGTAEKLPFFATQRYFGNLRGLGPEEGESFKRSTQLCTANREAYMKTGLSGTQSMKRIKRLIEFGCLGAEIHREGQSFYFWLPERITKPMFSRTMELLAVSGMTKEPAPDVGFESLASAITQVLIVEFSHKQRAAV